ncbi:MAG: hypothetical protein FWD71_21290 [Oscillospiraceae bacterium]|nr:hypothetical protein [Oscillospiraceae bacterium]
MIHDFEIGHSNDYSTITDINNINFYDTKEIDRLIEDFADKYAYADIEYALTISPVGKAYTLKGISNFVSPKMLGKDILKGSIGIHNHPLRFGENMDDSFSKLDLAFAVEYKTGKQYLISGERRNALEYTGNLTREKIEGKYDEAFAAVRSIALETGIDIYAEQQQIMEKLSEILEGFVFYGRF